jgi:hypothetical protein
VDASGGFLASAIEGKMRWMTLNGPGETVRGRFDFVRTNSGTFILFPKDEPGVQEPDRQVGNAIGDDSELTRRMREYVRRNRAQGGGGTSFPEMTSTEDNGESMDLQFLSDFLRTGKMTQDEFIAVDIHGKFDVEYNNPGPEISSKGQLCRSGYLSTFNEEEIATKRRKARKRFLAQMPSEMYSGDLGEEKTTLSRSSSVSSVSAISVDQKEPQDGFRPCDSNCWLKKLEIRGPHSENRSLQPLASESALRSEKAQIYTQIEPGYTRVLSVMPGQPDQPVICGLHPICIPSASRTETLPTEPYEALSYTWGGQRPTHPIICNGATMMISGNLYTALVHLRLADIERRLWVDAVCINQGNVNEKNEQIPLMMDIYKHATRIVAWLGQSSNNSSIAIAAVKRLDTVEGRRGILQRKHDDQCVETLGKVYQAMVGLYDRPWFRRSWVRQEVAVAKTVRVLCGKDEVSWYSLKRSAARLERVHEVLNKHGALPSDFNGSCVQPLQYLTRGWVFGQHVLRDTGEIKSIWYYHTGGLLDLLISGREFEATDARDKIYSILGMARIPMEAGGSINRIHSQRERPSLPKKPADIAQALPETMVIDYSKSISYTYERLAKFFVNRDLNLDIVCIAAMHRAPQRSTDLPSWAPDWRLPSSVVEVDADWDFFTYKFAAAGFTKAVQQNYDEVGVLKVEGWLADEIETFTGFTTYIPRPPLVPHSTLKPYDQENDRRQLCKTVYGRNGLVPREAELRDKIFVLKGARLPFILRPMAHQEAKRGPDGRLKPYSLKFEVVGACWMPDLMFGSAIKQYEDQEVEPLRILLV